jgi:hypothetical protein
MLTENGSVSWSDLFDRYRKIIDVSPDLLGPSMDTQEIDDVCDESDQESEDLDDIDCDADVRPDWMILSDMRPDAEIAIASNLGFRNIDKNYE